MSYLPTYLDHLNLPTITLFLALTLAGYLSYLCFSPPNDQSHVTPHSTDRLKTGFAATALIYWVLLFAATFAYQLFLVLLPPSQRPDLCYSYDLLDKNLLVWSCETRVFVGVVTVFASIRLWSFRTLGKDFTFVLAKPSKLVTTGIYAYIQHPSYTGLIPVLVAWSWFLLRLDGVLACFLPEWVAGWNWWLVRFVPSSAFIVLSVWGIWVRVRDEEQMMKREFGKEWVEWSGRTKRFVPLVF